MRFVVVHQRRVAIRCRSSSSIIDRHRHIARDHSLTCGGGEDAQRPEPEPRRVCQPSRVTEILRHFVSRQMRILAATAWSCVTTIARASRCAEGTMGGCRLVPERQNQHSAAKSGLFIPRRHFPENGEIRENPRKRPFWPIFPIYFVLVASLFTNLLGKNPPKPRKSGVRGVPEGPPWADFRVFNNSPSRDR